MAPQAQQFQQAQLPQQPPVNFEAMFPSVPTTTTINNSNNRPPPPKGGPGGDDDDMPDFDDLTRRFEALKRK